MVFLLNDSSSANANATIPRSTGRSKQSDTANRSIRTSSRSFLLLNGHAVDAEAERGDDSGVEGQRRFAGRLLSSCHRLSPGRRARTAANPRELRCDRVRASGLVAVAENRQHRWVSVESHDWYAIGSPIARNRKCLSAGHWIPDEPSIASNER